MSSAQADWREELQDAGEWSVHTLSGIREVRERLKGVMGDLQHSLNGEGLLEPLRSEKICQLTRLLVGESETLHCLSQLYVIYTQHKPPSDSFDPDLVEEVRGLLAKAADTVSEDESQRNCRERLRFAEKRMASWAHPELRPRRG
jgi:hypothetical protein